MPASLALIGPAIGGVSSLLGGIFGGNAASTASQQEVQALRNAITQTQQAVQGGQEAVDTGAGYVSNAAQAGQTGIAGALAGGQANASQGNQWAQQLLAPFAGAGSNALTSLTQLAGPGGPLTNQFSFNPSDLQNDPGYQFTLQQGQQALQRSAAAQGGLFSSGTMKSLAGYTTGTANQYFNDAFNRAQSTFSTNQQQALNRISTLQNLAGQGLSASGLGANLAQNQGQFSANYGLTGAGQIANLGMTGAQNYLQGQEFNAGLGLQGAQSVNQLLSGIGQAQAGGTVGSANSWLNAIPGIGSSLIQLAGGIPSGVVGGGGAGGTALPPPVSSQLTSAPTLTPPNVNPPAPWAS